MELLICYTYRIGQNELFIDAPNDESHRTAMENIAPEATFDQLLEAWRLPWSDGSVDTLLERLRTAVTNQVQDERKGLTYGYAQTTLAEGGELQIDALRNAGIPDDMIFYDKLSGRYPEFTELDKCLNRLKEGDTLMVFQLNRLARSLKQLADTLLIIREKKICLKSISEEIDTSFHKFENFIEHVSYASNFEIEANRLRTIAGLKEAAQKGRKRGGRRTSMTRKKLDQIVELALEGKNAGQIAEAVGLSRATIYRQIPGSIKGIVDANKEGGKQAVESLMDQVILRMQSGVTPEKREEIMKFYENNQTIAWIANYFGFNRETIRRVVYEETQ